MYIDWKHKFLSNSDKNQYQQLMMKLSNHLGSITTGSESASTSWVIASVISTRRRRTVVVLRTVRRQVRAGHRICRGFCDRRSVREVEAIFDSKGFFLDRHLAWRSLARNRGRSQEVADGTDCRLCSARGVRKFIAGVAAGVVATGCVKPEEFASLSQEKLRQMEFANFADCSQPLHRRRGQRGVRESCPMNLSYVSHFPWDRTSCLPDTTNMSSCCMTLLSVLAIGLSQRLRSTSLFRLPSISASADCLASFQSQLSELSLPSTLVPTCFPSPEQFVISPDYCDGIVSLRDWKIRLGNSTSVDTSCAPDLLDLTRCAACLSSRLTALDGNTSHATNCFYLTVTYAAGIANNFGPEDPRDSSCILGLSAPSRPYPQLSSTSPSHAAIYASSSAAAAFLLVSISLALYLCRSRRQRKNRACNTAANSKNSQLSSFTRPNIGAIWYNIRELEKSTAYFSQRNFIGRGGFGVVYRGVLSNGSPVAVKHVLESEFQGEDEFRNEVEIISNLRHRNLVPLRGCCITDAETEQGRQRFLVYDFMPNGSLDEYIFRDLRGGVGKRPPLTWPQRKNIILDVAKALAYLHYGIKPAIFHRDIKATNILLDDEMRARVSDFGLARQSREGQSHLTTRVAGTHGYLSPEYALYGQLTEKSDVYSFGMVVLEIMSGRRALDMASPSGIVLITDWAWKLVKDGRVEEVFDRGLVSGEGCGPKGIMERFVLVGILCAHVMVAFRPTIEEALRILEGDVEVPAVPDRPM
ncbi:probable receptor-like protein kinase At1g11050 [Phalaenopsis equestris]|uniref:probable receptor-like protein kinase At1g11050 n=1 Tax=Phalaenopsis equestris TaxID=78828 RepID=UPI0009E2E655|nr:probable receptor-like protein kinase At1g11050 [Phalaenopsis equestris]